MYEALRLHPTVPLASRVCPHAATIEGHKFASGRVLLNKIALCEDPAIFPNPSQFDPSRFSRGEYGSHGSSMVAFGIGPRMCVGYRLAEAEILAMLAHTLRHFVVEPGSVAPVENLLVTLSVKNGCFLRLTPL